MTDMRIKTFIILSASFLLLSCAKETAMDGVAGLPMQVVAGLASTKASVQTADLQEFWLQVDCPSDAGYSYFTKVSRSGTSWCPDMRMYWKDETTAVAYSAASFGGHAFTGTEFASGVNLSVPADQHTQAGLDAADLLTVKATRTTYEATADGTLPVALEHGLVKVNIVLSLGSQFYDNGYGCASNPVTAFTLSGTRLGFNFQPATGTVSATAGTEADVMPFALSYTPGTAAAKTSVATYEAILVPQTIAAGALTITFIVGANLYTWTNAGAITLAAGQTVNLPVSVTAAPPNVYGYVDMGTVVIGGVEKSLKWAACNMGADNPWDYGDYYSWGATATQTSYDWAHYPFMQEGQSDWRYITKYTVASGEISAIWYDGEGHFVGDGETSFADYDYADDAARQLWGGNWRIPTDEEWTALLNTDLYDWVWTTDYLGSGTNGRLVTRKDGTGPCAGNSIFLPAAGCRSNAALISAGSAGCYWSSSLNIYSFSGWSVVVYSGGVNSLSLLDRRFGLSLRPVTE